MEQLRPRAGDRVRLDFDAFLGSEDWAEVPVSIRDLSSYGFKCCCSERLSIGNGVTLRIPEFGQFPATIAWQLGEDAGARFDTPLPMHTMLSIMLAVLQEQLEAAAAAESEAASAPTSPRSAGAARSAG